MAETPEAGTGTELDRLAADPRAPGALGRVRQLCAEGVPLSARERHCAAVVLGTSDDPAEVARAQALALEAMAGHRPARRLAAELYDRLRVLAGRPQKFGTQVGTDGAPWPVDPATTDSERAKWDLPPSPQSGRRPGG